MTIFGAGRASAPAPSPSRTLAAMSRNAFAPKVLELALDFFGPDRVLFASDTPFGAGDGQSFTGEVLHSIEAMQIAPDLRAAILSGNAQRALKIA